MNSPRWSKHTHAAAEMACSVPTAAHKVALCGVPANWGGNFDRYKKFIVCHIADADQKVLTDTYTLLWVVLVPCGWAVCRTDRPTIGSAPDQRARPNRKKNGATELEFFY